LNFIFVNPDSQEQVEEEKYMKQIMMVVTFAVSCVACSHKNVVVQSRTSDSWMVKKEVSHKALPNKSVDVKPMAIEEQEQKLAEIDRQIKDIEAINNEAEKFLKAIGYVEPKPLTKEELDALIEKYRRK
jgi:hypothetical protein